MKETRNGGKNPADLNQLIDETIGRISGSKGSSLPKSPADPAQEG